MNCNVVISNY